MAEDDEYVQVAVVDAIEEGQIYPVTVDDEPRLLTKVDGHLYAVDAICTHEYAELADGDIEDVTLWCPLHQAGFDVRTGTATNPPARIPLRTYDVQTRDGCVQIARRARGN